MDFRSGYYWTIFWKRMGAYMIDSLIVMTPLLVIIYYFTYQDYERYDYAGNYQYSLLHYILVYGTAIFVLAYYESSKSMSSFGKRFLGLYITDESGHALSFQKAIMRNVFKYGFLLFAALIPIISLIYIVGQIVFYAMKHQFFHDTLSKTIISPRTKPVTV